MRHENERAAAAAQRSERGHERGPYLDVDAIDAVAAEDEVGRPRQAARLGLGLGFGFGLGLALGLGIGLGLGLGLGLRLVLGSRTPPARHPSYTSLHLPISPYILPISP